MIECFITTCTDRNLLASKFFSRWKFEFFLEISSLVWICFFFFSSSFCNFFIIHFTYLIFYTFIVFIHFLHTSTRFLCMCSYRVYSVVCDNVNFDKLWTLVFKLNFCNFIQFLQHHTLIWHTGTYFSDEKSLFASMGGKLWGWRVHVLHLRKLKKWAVFKGKPS